MAGKTTAREVARRAPELQSLPESYQRISEVIDRKDSSSEMIAGVVSEDAGIASRVLRLVNRRILRAHSGRGDIGVENGHFRTKAERVVVRRRSVTAAARFL